MILKLIFLAAGVITIFIGIISFFTGEIFFKYSKDAELYDSFMWILMGILFIVISLNLKKSIEYSKCPKCKESYSYIKLEKGLCPKCNIKTIDIEEYYTNNKDE